MVLATDCRRAAEPVLLSDLLLLWPSALARRYQRVFADTGTYLSQATVRYLG
jgi:hypothetical protein